jgi:hypothetical protein
MLQAAPLSVTFGLRFDVAPPTVALPTLGQATVGPLGLLQLLETRLGLKRVDASLAERREQYRQLLEQAPEEAFFRSSLAKDPIATAATLLQWRDGLVEAGWDGHADAADSLRLRGLAEVENRVEGVLAPGVGDRLGRVLAVLRSGMSAHLSGVVVVDPDAVLPGLWRQVFQVLGAEYREDEAGSRKGAAEDANSDLAGLQRALGSLEHSQADGAVQQARGDGSVVFLSAFSESTLAPAVAQLAEQARSESRSLVLVGSGSTALLEQALAGRDEPSPGMAALSRARSIPQVLALALRLHWDPLDPAALFDFLSHPVCPLPGRLRHALAAAVADSPGVGGPRWRKALERLESGLDEAGSRAHREKTQQELNTWVLVERADPQRGAPGKLLAGTCSLVAQWAAGRAEGADDPASPESRQFRFLMALASNAAKLLAAWDRISRSQLERLLDQVTGEGWKGGTGSPELGHPLYALHPGGVHAASDEVVWWGFTEPGPLPLPPWTREEQDQLQQHGATFASAGDLAAWERRAWLGAVLAARKRIVFTTPRSRGGEDTAAHPLQSRVEAIFGDSFKGLKRDADRLLQSGGDASLLKWVDRPYQALPPLRRWWKLSDGTALKVREQESFSSLELAIYSPYQWVLRYAARFRPGPLSSRSLVRDSRLKGTLLHRLAELLFSEEQQDVDWRSCDQAGLERWIDSRWPRLLEEEGAVFLQPGAQADGRALCLEGKAALWRLLKHLRSANVVRAVAEREMPPVPFEGTRLGGYIDLAVQNQQGDWAVVDMKYGGADKRSKQLKDNIALQLAVYGYLQSAVQDAAWPSSAFYILSRKRLLAQDAGFFSEASQVKTSTENPGPQTCWQDALTVWRWRRRQLDDGWIELTVTGTEDLETQEAEPDRNPPIESWKADQDQDRYSDFKALTGWNPNA